MTTWLSSIKNIFKKVKENVKSLNVIEIKTKLFYNKNHNQHYKKEKKHI